MEAIQCLWFWLASMTLKFNNLDKNKGCGDRFLDFGCFFDLGLPAKHPK